MHRKSSDIRPASRLNQHTLEGRHRAALIRSQSDFVKVRYPDMIERVQTMSHDVADFFDEEDVVGELELVLALRLHTEQIQPAQYGGLRETGLFGHAAHAPPRRVRFGRREDLFPDRGVSGKAVNEDHDDFGAVARVPHFATQSVLNRIRG